MVDSLQKKAEESALREEELLQQLQRGQDVKQALLDESKEMQENSEALEKMLAEKERALEAVMAQGADESKQIATMKKTIAELEERCEALLQGGDQAKSKEISKLMESQKKAPRASPWPFPHHRWPLW